MTASHTLNADQLAAITEFAHRHGRRWKSELRAVWSTGRDERHPLLRQLRNDFGPNWLTRFRLPA